jgi:hypothetical protein
MALDIEATAARVVEAYKSKGLKAAPFQLSPNNEYKPGCCCGLGALACDSDSKAVPLTMADISAAAGLTARQTSGFMSGFDMGLTDHDPNRHAESAYRAHRTKTDGNGEYAEGNLAGYAAAEAVINAGLRV